MNRSGAFTQRSENRSSGRRYREMKCNEKSRAGRIGVIGGGLGGLAAACTLAARGYEVVAFEKNRWLGGKAAVLSEGGFRFDMGPTILLMPSVLERIFCRGRARLERRARSDPSRPAMAIFLRRWFDVSTCTPTQATDGIQHSMRFAPSRCRQPGLSPVSRPLGSAR